MPPTGGGSMSAEPQAAELTIDQVKADLAETNPRWVIWRSTTGRWWADCPHLTPEEGKAGCIRMVYGDTVDRLKKRMDAQDARAQNARTRKAETW
ncbi:hypothetical protein SAMN05216275_14195 [Streptosporangium canum]|uniref:Uncharacterized protein n=2 Tax=Streptosporangium canum TaxID=324952 RepID=A0A1I4DIV0_9ACTN|nr:hypothetical protein SAMN05216275_14195 [Streptosporangium canum]